ncbi:M61 family metallopeptidase [Aliikangiella coralliicola]|uniref:M61 family metallopeptidase n=2 Tax=Aliikangiella coralliicola TaxID=2592383 RepID=A0A545UIP4_9GAMM|nr:M61 family metallopeptidase [Aliikangiella coralliicola]
MCSALPAWAKVDYLIEMSDPEHHLAEITIKFPKGHSELELKMPAWRTGKYKLLNQANGIRHFQAQTKKRKALKWTRRDKSSWVVDNPEQSAIVVKYTLYANELGLRTRHIDNTHAFLDATATFMYSPQLMDQVHKVELKVPDGWKSYSGMVQVDKHQFIAQNYDQLADSPIETGINELHEFSEDGRDYQVVFWGKANRSNDKIVEDLRALVGQSQTIWKGYPYKKYVFMIHATSGATGATEHLNSTVIQRPRHIFGKRSDYLDRFLRTASHELVHTWNVKAYRPQALVPYDYQQENYSDLLWIAEGSTSYLQDRLLLTAKLQTVKEFLTMLSKRVDKFRRKPGTKVQSVKQGSFETWTAQGGDFANNHSAGIYSEGFMASWLLDFQILSDTKLKSGYKNIHQMIYQKKEQLTNNNDPLKTIPFSEEDIKQLLKQLTDKDYQDWWQDNIDSPLSIDFEALLKKAGLQFAALKEKDFKVWTGFKSNESKGLITLTEVEKDGPAWRAGLTTKDQLIAVNGYQVNQQNLETWLKQFKPEDTIELTLFRNQQLVQKSLTLGKIAKKVHQIELMKKPSKKQKAFFKAWLGVDFPEEKSES